jgi:hypothetical protein
MKLYALGSARAISPFPFFIQAPHSSVFSAVWLKQMVIKEKATTTCRHTATVKGENNDFEHGSNLRGQ